MSAPVFETVEAQALVQTPEFRAWFRDYDDISTLSEITGRVPIVPQLNSRILEAVEAGGEIDMWVPHRCPTTHCIGGWALHLAGEAWTNDDPDGQAGKLEYDQGFWIASALLFLAAGSAIPDMAPGASATALAGLKARAALEAQR